MSSSHNFEQAYILFLVQLTLACLESYELCSDVKFTNFFILQVQSASATSVGSGGRSPKAGGAPKSGSTVRNRYSLHCIIQIWFQPCFCSSFVSDQFMFLASFCYI